MRGAHLDARQPPGSGLTPRRRNRAHHSLEDIYLELIDQDVEAGTP